MMFRRRGRVQIYDTDASGLIFYGAPARWFADGEQETGLLKSSLADSVILLAAQEFVVTIPRAQIKSIEALAKSLMPEGLEQGMTPAEMRDLIAFLQEPKP